MGRSKSADDNYDDEYAKEKGKLDARRDAKRKAPSRYDDEYDRERAKHDARQDIANERAAAQARAIAQQNAASWKGCLIVLAVLLAVPVVGCGGFMLLGMFVVPRVTTSATETGTSPPSKPSDGPVQGAIIVPTEPFNPPEDATAFRKPSVNPPSPTAKSAPPSLLTINPAKGTAVLLGTSQYAVGAASKSADEQERWVKMGEVIQLTEPTEVEVLSGDKNYSKVRLNGKVWVIASVWLPAEIKK